MNFRYTLTPKQRVHTFEPKRLPAETDLKDLRFAQLGAVLANQKRLAALPSSKHFGLAWEALALAFILILPYLFIYLFQSSFVIGWALPKKGY